MSSSDEHSVRNMPYFFLEKLRMAVIGNACLGRWIKDVEGRCCGVSLYQF
jgi:hypothetical protein